MVLDYQSMEEHGVTEDDFEKAVSQGDISFIAYAANMFNFDMDCFPDGGHPLSLACEQGELDLAKELVSWGADIHWKEDEMPTPLILAAENGHFHVVKWLVENEAELDYVYELEMDQDDQGYSGSALSAAIETGHLKIAEYLIDRGAALDSEFSNPSYKPFDPIIEPPAPWCPILQIAELEEHNLIEKAVKKADFKKLDKEITSRLLSIFIDKEQTDNIFHIAKSNIMAINRPMEPNAFDQILFPLELAAENQCEESLDFMIHIGADLMLKNVDGDYIFYSLALIWPEKSHDILNALSYQFETKSKKLNVQHIRI